MYGAYACMIANPMNTADPGYHTHVVLYFEVLIRSSFGGVCEHRYIHIYVHTESLITANKKIDNCHHDQCSTCYIVFREFEYI
jgi:hypothetical protein